MLSVPPWVPVWQMGLALAVLVSVVVLRALARPRGRWGLALRRRFVLGVPWGTLLTVVGVAAVYLFVQGGLAHLRQPLVLPFRAWSYFYPLGMVASGFSHAGMSHLVGNLLGTLVFGTLAEYAWGHFPTRRGESTFSSWRTNPYARIAAFPLAVVVVGVVISLFGLGPVIGFSGVVFAFAGLSLVRYPLPTLVVVVVGNVVNLLWDALRSPVSEASSRPRFDTPWWAGIAIQGHAVGLLVGVVLGALLVRRRRVRPDAARLWLAAVAFAAAKGLWAVYAFRGNNEFVLFRALGVAAVFLLAALVAAAVAASERPLVPAIDLGRREAAVGLLVTVVLALSFVAVPYNMLAVGDPAAGVTAENSVTVEDYTVFYAEDVPNQLVSAFDVEFLDESSNVNASGVIVVSEQRNIWWQVVGARELAFEGQRRVVVGGVGWREGVFVERTGWSTVGGPSAYRVTLRTEGEPATLAYRSDPATAEPRIAGRNVTVEPTAEGFRLNVTRREQSIGTAPMPGENETVTAGGITFEREDANLFAVSGDTRVKVAKHESYN